jgi:hypothetical protein
MGSSNLVQTTQSPLLAPNEKISLQKAFTLIHSRPGDISRFLIRHIGLNCAFNGNCILDRYWFFLDPAVHLSFITGSATAPLLTGWVMAGVDGEHVAS